MCTSFFFKHISKKYLELFWTKCLIESTQICDNKQCNVIYTDLNRLVYIHISNLKVYSKTNM